MAVTFSLQFAGEDVVSRTLERFADRSDDASPAFRAIADAFAAFERRQFESEGVAGTGSPWAPLSPRYAAWKARRYPGQPILVATGALRRSLTERPLGVERIGSDYAELGSEVAYGRFHQQGDGVPQRRPVDLPESERRDMVKVLQRWIVTGKV